MPEKNYVFMANNRAEKEKEQRSQLNPFTKDPADKLISAFV